MIFDSVFNSFRGIIAYFRVLNGTINKGDKVKFVATGKEYDADEIGVLGLDLIPQENPRCRRRGVHHFWHQKRQRGQGR